jgi:hypothetical protein
MCHSSVLRQTLTARLDASHNRQPDLKTAAVTTRDCIAPNRDRAKVLGGSIAASSSHSSDAPVAAHRSLRSRPRLALKVARNPWQSGCMHIQRCSGNSAAIYPISMLLQASERTANSQTTDCSATWHVAKINSSRMLGSVEHVTRLRDRRLIGSLTKASKLRQNAAKARSTGCSAA